MDEMIEVRTQSVEETARVGCDVGRLLSGGEVIALLGDLGAGKTAFVRGLAQGLELDPGVIYSPTFTLVAVHEGRMTLHHIDLYRLADPVDADAAREIGFDDAVASDGVTVVEWFDRLAADVAREATPALRIEIALGEGDDRTIRIAATGPGGDAVLGRFVANG